MAWFKIDDGFHGHPKIVGVSTSAVGLWTLAGTWASQYLTDGFVPSAMVGRLGGTKEDADALVAAGLWIASPEGYAFHDWWDYQPDAASTKAKREAESEGGLRGNHTRWHVGRGVVVKSCEFCKESGTRSANDQVGDRVPDQAPDRVGDWEPNGVPDSPPTPPGPGPGLPVTPSGVTGGGPRKRASRIPEPFVVTADMREWAAMRTPLVDVESSTERFVNHWRAKSGKDATKLDWPATWRNWLLRDQENLASRTKLTPTQRAMQTAAAGRAFLGRSLTTLELEGGAS